MEGSESQSQGVECTAEKWDEIRNSFQSSIMVDTKLSSLAENVGTTEWPISGADETPSKYIYLTFDELKMIPEIGERPQRIDLLVDIMKETLAFDDPFGDMVDQVEASSQRDDNVLKNLERLKIPEDFPIIISRVSSATKQLCADEEIKTLSEFISFSQNMAQNVVVGGDFRNLLNCIAHIDEEGIATFLPFRVGKKGIHLPEALGHLVEALEIEDNINFEEDLTDENAELITANMNALFHWFTEEKGELSKIMTENGDLSRYLLVLNDPAKEKKAAILVTLYFQPEKVLPSRRGIWGSISRLWNKK